MLLWTAMLLVLSLAAMAAAPSKVALYAAVGNELTRYEVDSASGVLTKRESVTLPANIQYVWPHPSKKYLYVAWSDGGPGSALGAPTGGRNHGVHAYRIDGAASGVLHPHGQPAKLDTRPVHISVTPQGRHLLVAHTIPSEITVHEIHADGTLGGLVAQKEKPDAGVYAHQVRADPRHRSVILVTRGNVPAGGKAEDPGALKVYTYDPATGALHNRASVTPPASRGGYGFQPRHVDFHPSQPWVFLSVEGQNQLQVYRDTDGMLTGPAYTVSSLKADTTPAGQAAGAIHVHPNGRFVYQSNRKTEAGGGENSIAVYSIDAKTGEPRRIQNIDTQGFSPRTFTIDPEGRLLIVANQIPVGSVPANLAVFCIHAKDGTLDFVRKYELPAATNAKSLFWAGIVPLP